jgi:hypothetical protein
MVGGAQSCHPMIENEKRESWSYATEELFLESEMALL